MPGWLYGSLPCFPGQLGGRWFLDLDHHVGAQFLLLAPPAELELGLLDAGVGLRHFFVCQLGQALLLQHQAAPQLLRQADILWLALHATGSTLRIWDGVASAFTFCAASTPSWATNASCHLG